MGLEGREAGTSSGGGAASGGDAMSNRFVLLRAPFDNNRTIRISGQRNVHHFVIETFKPRCKVRRNTGANFILLNKVAPLYVIDTGDRGMYMSDRLYQEIQRHTNLESFDFCNNVLVKRVAGSCKLVGINAPFITGTTDQAATNSSCTMSTMLGKNIHEKERISQGKVTLAGTGLKTVSAWEESKTTYNATTGEVGTMTGHMDWENFSKCQLAATPAINDGQWIEVKSEGSDEAYELYPMIAAPQAIRGLDAVVDNEDVVFPKLSGLMTEIDITESEGIMFSWDTPCDSLLSHAPSWMANPKTRTVLAADTAIAADIAAKVNDFDTINNPTPVVADPVLDRPVFDKIGADGRNLWKGKMYKSGNYIDYDTKQPSLLKAEPLDSFYVRLITPPTTTTADGQHVTIQMILETEIDIEIQLDMLQPYNWSGSGTNKKFRGRSNNASMIKTPYKFEGDWEGNGTSLNAPAQKWGYNAVFSAQ